MSDWQTVKRTAKSSSYVAPSLRTKVQTYDEMYPQLIKATNEKRRGATSTTKQLSHMVSRLAEQEAMEKMRLQIRAEKEERERLEFGCVPNFANYHRKVAARAKAAEMQAWSKDMQMLANSEYTLFQTIAKVASQRLTAATASASATVEEEDGDDFIPDDASDCSRESTDEIITEDF